VPNPFLPDVPGDKPDAVLRAELALDQVTSVLVRDPRLRVTPGVRGINVERAHSTSVVSIRYLRGAGVLRGIDYPAIFISSCLSDETVNLPRDLVVRGCGLNARAALGALVEKPSCPVGGIAHCSPIGIDTDWSWQSIGHVLTVAAILFGMDAVFGQPLARRCSDTRALEAFSHEVMAMPQESPDRYRILRQRADFVYAKPCDFQAGTKAAVFMGIGALHPIIGPGLEYRLYLPLGIEPLAKEAAVVEFLNTMEGSVPSSGVKAR
jgi:hypothetical protein